MENQNQVVVAQTVSIDLKEGKKITGSRELEFTRIPQDIAEALASIMPAALWVGFETVEDAILAKAITVRGPTREEILTLLDGLKDQVFAIWKALPNATEAKCAASWKVRHSQIKELFGRSCDSKTLEALAMFVPVLEKANQDFAKIVESRIEKMNERTNEQDAADLF